MAYLLLGLAFMAVELWRLVAPHSHVPVMPLAARIVLPLAFAAAAFRRHGRERLAVLAMAVIGLAIWNRHVIGDPAWVSLAVIVCAAFMALVGFTLSPGTRRRTLRPALLAVGFAVLGFLIFYLPNLF